MPNPTSGDALPIGSSPFTPAEGEAVDTALLVSSGVRDVTGGEDQAVTLSINAANLVRDLVVAIAEVVGRDTRGSGRMVDALDDVDYSQGLVDRIEGGGARPDDVDGYTLDTAKDRLDRAVSYALGQALLDPLPFQTLTLRLGPHAAAILAERINAALPEAARRSRWMTVEERRAAADNNDPTREFTEFSDLLQSSSWPEEERAADNYLSTPEWATPTAPHACGLCDSPLRFDGMSGGYATYVCTAPDCDWWHISMDCCATGSSEEPISPQAGEQA